ncbi:MAG: hypothetical protein AAB320_07075 [Elusimicrobiota bacterium]
MRQVLLAALLLPTGTAFCGEPPREDKMMGSGERALITPSPVQWLRTYSLAPYKEHWALDAEVKDLSKDLPKLLKAFAKAGAVLTQPLEQFPASKTEGSQQLSFHTSALGGQAALKALQKIAKAAPPRVRYTAEPVPLAEVKDKISKLMVERKEHGAALAKTPATSALAEEMLEHLLTVESVRERTDNEVLINVTVRQTR